MIEVIPIAGVPEIRPGDDLAGLLIAAAGSDGMRDGDVVVVTQKVVSKAEGRLVPDVDRSSVVAAEARRVLRRSGELTIAETRHGFVCANAGVDSSNVDDGMLALLPLDPDASARKIRSRIAHVAGLDVAIVISDTFGRAWRLGQTNVAVGLAGLEPFTDYRGTKDAQGKTLVATRICTVDEIAGAAEMVMGKRDGVCAAVVRGVPFARGRGAAVDIVRPAADDLFR